MIDHDRHNCDRDVWACERVINAALDSRTWTDYGEDGDAKYTNTWDRDQRKMAKLKLISPFPVLDDKIGGKEEEGKKSTSTVTTT